MKIEKIAFYTLTCPHCGTKITLNASEFEEYRKATAEYGGSSVLCTEYDEDDKPYEINYVNFDCPKCGHYIPVVATDGENDKYDSDTFGFKLDKNVQVFYIKDESMDINDYINKVFFKEDEEVENE